MSGIEPFSSEPENIEILIKEAIYSKPSTIWDPISNEAKSMIKRMLIQDPDQRIKVGEILRDKWFQVCHSFIIIITDLRLQTENELCVLTHHIFVQGDCEMLAKVNSLYNSTEDLSETLTMSSNNSLDSVVNQSSALDLDSDYDTLSPTPKRFRHN